ncbi:hypothetical protein F383_39027 [Gossypium arboreum]|uniref:Uncharacterized protein n=1 Tax=Gossypium arboreum TaxID=29729 RepID=A0A0B0MNV1_GOSAR|nr:hypothetical protein F383_39027 [Gossypium arboreum]
MEICVPSHRAWNKCNVHVKLLDLTLQVNDGIPLHALHARGGSLQVKQVWGACSNSHGLAIS